MRKFFLLFITVFSVTAVHAQLTGTYTVDGAGVASAGNYLTVNDAVSDMVSGTRADGGPVNGPGISGPVVVRLVTGSGPYTEQVTIPAIAGASAVNTVRITGGPGREMITFSGTTTSDRHVIKINGARHITLDSLTILNTDATYGYGVHITNSADSNTVSNCSVITSTSATTSSFAGITISGATVTVSGDWGDDNLIMNNTVNGGYYGITMRGISTTVFNQRNKVIGNTIQNYYYYGIYCYQQNLTEIIDNTITARPAATASGYGIYMYYADRFKIEQNKLYTLGTYGIYTYYGNYQGGTGTTRATITNNMIGGGWLDTAPYGIYVSTNSRYLDIFHNSVSLDYGNGRCIYILSGLGHDVRNNSFAIFNSTTGYALYVGSAAYVTNVDYNNYHAPGSSNFIYIAAAYTTATYIGGGGYNLNSRNGDPIYLNTTNDLHTSALQLHDGGTNVGITTDIDGDVRPMAPTALYDIGADEFTPVLNDAAVVAMPSPAQPFNAGVQNVDAVLFNYGSNTLTSATINWTVNSVAQTPYAWTGSVASYTSSSPATIGTYNFLSGNTYDIVIWTSNPNGVTDQQFANDTLHMTVCVALNGVYSVGGVSPDFATINDAVSALACGGVTGPVTLRLAAGAGPFTEQVIIPPVPGASPLNTVRFTGGANRETVQYSATLTGERAVFKINGARHIILDSMTINATGTTYGYGVQITNSADSNIVRNCIVNVSTTSTSSNFAGITLSAATVATNADNGDDNLIQNNIVNGGYYGITMRGTSTTVFNNRNRVVGNTIYNTYYYSVYCYYQEQPVISNNTISQRPTATTSGYGIYAYYTNGFMIESNDLDSIGGNGIYTYYGNYQAGTGTARARIVNNMVGGTWRDAASPYGIYISTNSRYIDIWHNSVSLDIGNGRGLYISSGLGNDVQNNSFALYGSATGYAVYVTSTAYVSAMDYNNYYAPGSSNFIYLGAAYTPATYIGAAGFNTNSQDGNPYYIDPANNLHCTTGPLYDAGTNLGVTGDIDGDIRPLAPSVGYDIGADEFTAMINDNMVTTLLTPADAACADSNATVSVVITNLGLNAITSVPITAEISGYTSTTLNTTYTGNLTFGQSDTVVVGTFNSHPGGTLNVVVFSTLIGDQNMSNDTLDVQLLITPIAVAATGTNDTTCMGSPASLTVNTDGFLHTWYDAASGGNLLATGDTLTTTPLFSNTTYYVESRNSIAGNLTTTFAGGNGCNGTMFDVIPTLDLQIDSFAVNIGSTALETVRIFVCTTGTYAGNETNPGAWVLQGIVNVTGMGAGQPTMIPIGGINMLAGQTYGVYVALVNSTLDYSTGSQSFANNDMTVNTGAGLCGNFASVNAGRIFNGTIYYRTASCPFPVRTPIDAIVVAPPVVALGNDTAACVSFTLDAGNPGLTYIWSTMDTTQQITVTTSGQYSVEVSDMYCTVTDTINLEVNPNPVLVTSVADGNICVGESDTLYVSGANLYNWNFGGIGTMEIVTPLSTTAYTVYGLDTNGCSDTDTLIVTVNPLPVVTVSLPIDTACFSGGTITLAGESPAGGTWSGTAVTGNSFDPAIAGVGMHTITYDYTDANGCSSSATDSVWVDLCSGIDQPAEIASAIYPNPNTGTFTLQLGGSGEMQVTVYDAIGQIVSSERKTPGTYTMNIAAAGVYVLVIENEQGMKSMQRVVIQR